MLNLLLNSDTFMLEKYWHFSHWFLKLVTIVCFLGIFWGVIGFVIPKTLPERSVSNSNKYGLIFQNEKWSGEIRVIGDIWALPGVTVTIEPGTRVRVNTLGDQFNLHYLPWGLKSGLNTGEARFGVRNGELFWDENHKIQIRLSKLVAIGTKEQPVIFESNSPSPGSSDDFNIISFTSGIISHAQLSNYRRMLLSGNDIVIRESEFSNILECALCIDGSSPTISTNLFSNTHRSHIWIFSGSPRISDNVFNLGLGEGITYDPDQIGAARIYHNDFEMPDKIALNLITGGELYPPQIYLNNFSGSSIIELPCDSRASFDQNQIRGFVRFIQRGNCDGQMVWGKNYWASVDTQTIIKEKFLGKEENFDVLIPEILATPPASGHRF